MTYQKLDMGLQFVTIGVAFPVEIHHDRGFLNIGNELLVLLYQSLELLPLNLFLIFGPFSHQNFQNLSQPFLNFCSFQIFAQGL